MLNLSPDWTTRFVFGCVSVLGIAAHSGCGQMDSFDAPWLLTTANPSEATERGQWSGHRGAMLQGVSLEEGLPTRFDRDVNLRWAVALPGIGNSSPTVHGDRIFLTAELAGETPQLSVLCIDRVTGDLVWQRDVGAPVGRTHRKNGYATATVATDGTRVYATFGSLGIFCLDFDGETDLARSAGTPGS